MHSKTIRKYLKFTPNKSYENYINNYNGGFYANGGRVELSNTQPPIGSSILYGIMDEDSLYDLIEINIINGTVRNNHLIIGLHYNQISDDSTMTLLMDKTDIVRFVDFNINIDNPLKSILPECKFEEYVQLLTRKSA